MNDLTTFSGAEAELLERGFLLGFENTWKSVSYKSNLPFKIYIQPYFNVLVVLIGYDNDKLDSFTIKAVWRLNKHTTISNFTDKIESLGGDQPNFYVRKDGAKSINDYVEDPSILQYSSFRNVNSASILPSFYDLLLQCTDLQPWNKQSHLWLVDPNESSNLSSDDVKKLSQERLRIAVSNLGLDQANFGIK